MNPAGSRRDVSTLDLGRLPHYRRSEARLRRRMRAITRSLDLGAPALLDALGDALGAPCHGRVDEIDVVAADDRAITSLPIGWLGRVCFQPGVWGLVALEPRLALGLCDLLLEDVHDRAGAGRARPLSALEENVLMGALAELMHQTRLPASAELHVGTFAAELKLFAAASRTVSLSFTLELPGLRGRGWWLLPERWFTPSRLAGHASPPQGVQRSPRWAALAPRMAPVWISFAPLELPPASIEHLAEGAVLVGPSLRQRALELLVYDTPLFGCALTGDLADDTADQPNIILGAALPTGETTRAVKTMPTSSNPRRTPDLDHVRVPIRAEIARFELPLGEIANLESGHLLDLERPLEAMVTLRMGELAVARGELVNIEGQLGIRVTEVLGGMDASLTRASKLPSVGSE